MEDENKITDREEINQVLMELVIRVSALEQTLIESKVIKEENLFEAVTSCMNKLQDQIDKDQTSASESDQQ